MTLKMSAESWKLENDLCRCCHSEGTHKNLSEPCLEGEEEIYSTMLQETLDIRIAPVSGPLGTVTYTICEVCIMRLQDAWSFKQQVLQCETRFNDLYTRNVIKMEPDSVIINVKEEAIDSDNEGFKEEKLADDSDEDFSMTFDDGNKSDESDMDVQEETKKGKPKPKAKPKAKAPARAAAKKKPVARSVKADAASSETQQSEPKEKKDATLTPEDLSEFTVVEEGTQKTYHCNKCDKVATTPASMKNHIRYLHLNVQACICDICKKEFKTRPQLKRHMWLHKLFDCPECSRQFTKDELGFHRADEHGVAMPTCGICGYRNNDQFRIIRHQRSVHLKEKNLSCSQCDMKFFSASHLRKHMVRHDPVRKYECKFCKKTFPRLYTMRLHERIHTGDKKKVCSVCGERFVQKSSLNYHMVKHHPDAV